MIKLAVFASLFAAFCTFSHARDVTFAWNANPAHDEVTSYRLEMQSNGAWVPMGSVAGDVLTLQVPNFPDNTTFVRAFAINAFGESDPSDPFKVGVKPGKVQGLKTTVIVNIQVATP